MFQLIEKGYSQYFLLIGDHLQTAHTAQLVIRTKGAKPLEMQKAFKHYTVVKKIRKGAMPRCVSIYSNFLLSKP